MTKIMICVTGIEELTPLLPPGFECQERDFGLHTSPGCLKEMPEDTLDATPVLIPGGFEKSSSQYN